MPVDQIPTLLLDALRQHIPSGATWLPLAGMVVSGAMGVLFLVKGAKLAPWLAAAALALLGAGGGTYVAHLFGAPSGLSAAIGGLAGLVLGYLLFRVLLALLVAGCLVSVALTLYSTNVLRGPVDQYLTRGFDAQTQQISLQSVDAAIAAPITPQAELAGLWNHLTQSVPNLQLSIAAIVLSTGVAGMVFGLLLPKLARAFWAASFGAALLGVASYALVHTQWPQCQPHFRQWGVIALLAVWIVSLLFNVADMHGGVRLRKSASHPQKPANGAPAAQT
jgi:hypothetical protein